MRIPGGPSTGLGLAIVSAIARAHGGIARVTPAGSVGGAMFVLELPAEQGRAMPPSSVSCIAEVLQCQ